MRDNEKLLRVLHSINDNLTGIRNLMRHEGEMQHITRLHNVDWEQMLLSALGNIASSNKEINKPQEAAVSEHKEPFWPVTIGEAIKALRLFCEKTDNEYEKLIMTWAADHLEKEAAYGPQGPNGVTWREAARTLRDLCKAQRYCRDCPARAWCETAVHPTLGRCPGAWEVPADE